MTNYFILGSCVTRDIFGTVEIKDSITYFARTSLISLMSEPILIKPEIVKLSSDFQKRMVIQDFHKSFFDQLAQSYYDYLLIDFIDERFDLFKINKTYITRSNELIQSKVIESFENCEHIRRLQEKIHLLWEQSCELFIKRLLEIFPENKIVLHEAYWSDKYLEDGELKQFPDRMLSNITQMNIMLRRYHSFFKRMLPRIRVVSETGYGDSKHKWGLSPYHFNEEYYASIFDQIHRN